MARRPSHHKIAPLWERRLFRRRQRRHHPTTGANPTARRSRRRPIRRLTKPAEWLPPAPWYVHLARLAIVLLGAGAIAGTAMYWTQTDSAKLSPRPSPAPKIQISPSSPRVVLARGQANGVLQQRLQTLIDRYPSLQPHIWLSDMAGQNYAEAKSRLTVIAASTIKIPLALALLQQVDRGQIRLDESLTLKKSMVAGGSGDMGRSPLGSKFTVRAALTAAITTSDNTATNMLIDRLGGPEPINRQWRSWGLETTVLQAPLPDFGGTNQTSAQELAALLQQLHGGTLLTPSSRQIALEIFRQTKRNTMLPAGVKSAPAQVAHKTGELAVLIADAGTIELADGKKYLAVALVNRPANDYRGEALIRQVAQLLVTPDY